MAIISGKDDPKAKRISVYFEGTGTIYEGMPVCYNYDTTDNWSGWGEATDGADPTEQGTTAEGEQNEGKYIRVELPATGNLMHFAGVVAGSEHAGQTGPKLLDIYVPNGAIVPVRCDVDTTTGVTVLSIAEGEEELGFLADASTTRPVAIAMETETGLDGTAGTTLAKLDPNIFMYQCLDGSALNIGSGTAYGRVNITTSSVALVWGPQFKFTQTGTGAGGMVAHRFEAHAAGTAVAGNVYGIWSQAEYDASGASASGNMAGVWSKSYVPSTAGTISGNVFGAQISLGLNKAIGGTTAYIKFDATTTSATTPDFLFIAGPDAGSCCYTADTTCGADDKLGCIKIQLAGVTAYLNVYSDTSS